MHQLAEAFLSDVAAEIGDYTALVLDDFQEIQESPLAISFMETLASYLPDSLRIIIASRLKPPFPSFARLLANREAALLPTGMLAFTREEVQQYYFLSGEVTFDGKQI